MRSPSRLRTLLGKYGPVALIRQGASVLRAELRAALPLSVLLRLPYWRRFLQGELAGNHDRVLLWRSRLGFHAALYQRPQQIARQMARQGCLVLYEADPLRDRVAALRREEPGLLLVNLRCLPLRRLLLGELESACSPRFLHFYSTDRTLSLRELKRFLRRGWRVLYEYVDHLSPLISGTARLPKAVSDKFDFVMAHPEIPVVATASLLYRDVERRRGGGNLILATNGVDCEFYRRWEPYEFEPAFRAILARGKPILLYYGALAAWLDYPLLRELAASEKYSLVLIGVKYDGSFDKSLRGVSGVDWLGPRDYAVLKYYAREADALLLPFLVNEVTRSTSPVKLFEYMALQRPIVSTDIDECRQYESVLIGQTRDDFVRQLERALWRKNDPDYRALLWKEAWENDWSRKAAAILELLKTNGEP